MTRADGDLSAGDLRRFSEALYARTGMMFGETKRYYVERRLRERMASVKAETVSAYLTILRADPAEFDALISAFTVNETYFYRELDQFQCLTDDILPEITRSKGPGDKIRIWSQPCSTGEEAYSIAIWLLENWRLVDAYNVEIVGSDIDQEALGRAKIGRFGARSLSRLPPKVIEAYFEPARRNGRSIIDDLRESVIFTAANLIDRLSMSAQGQFDVIFCRNVLIYFDDDSRARAAESLHRGLAPGGFLCLGHSESMSRIDARFQLRRFPRAIVYQRPVDA